MTVVELQTHSKQTNAECIQMLRDLLAEAEEGKIVAISLAAVEPSGACRTQSTSSNHFQAVLGALSILQHRMIAASERDG